MSQSTFNFLNYLGVEVISSNTSQASLSLAIKQHHEQHLGFVHGGVISSMADNTGWFVVRPHLEENTTVVTMELSLSYLRPAQGKFLTTVGKLLKKGKRSYFVTCEIFCDDVLVAFASSNLAVIDLPNK